MKEHDVNRLYAKLFFTAFLAFLLGALPCIMLSSGKYVYLGDYSIQIVPIMRHIHDTLREGFTSWDWSADIGMNFYGSNLFYGLASPFTVLSLLVPNDLYMYALYPLNALKIAVAAVTACLYIRKYVKKDSSAFIGGMLYAFSGFQLVSLPYQFSDVVALFPLLLFAFDGLLENKKRGGFAIMLGVMAFTNFFFFFGECIFLVIYFAVKLWCKTFTMNKKLFGKLAFETVAGLCLSMGALLPAYACLSGNQRATDSVFTQSLLVFKSSGTFWKILESLFMLPDSVTGAYIVDDKSLNIASCSLYIPLFAVIGVLAFVKKNKKGWIAKLFAVCAMFAALPVLNSVFSAFSGRYYARWFMMVTLIMCMTTAKYCDDFESYEIKKELKFGGAVVLFLSVMGLHYMIVTKKFKSISKYAFIINILLSISFLVLLWYIRYYRNSTESKSKSNKPNKPKLLIEKYLMRVVSVVCAVCLFSACYISSLDDYGDYGKNMILSQDNEGNGMKIDDTEYFRTDAVTGYSDFFNMNTSLIYGYPGVTLFHTMISGNTTDFYALVGTLRTSALITPGTSNYPLESFLSGKYMLNYNYPRTGGIDCDPKDVGFEEYGYNSYTVQNRYIYYKNSNYIPMGFTYDYYLNENNFTKYNFNEDNSGDSGTSAGVGLLADENSGKKNKDIPVKENMKLLLKAIWLDSAQIKKYSDILEPLPSSLKKDTSDSTYESDCKTRASSAGYYFKPDKTGFTSKIKLEKDNLVFYSVSYDEGFTAYVDGKKTEIEKVFGGLCAVKATKGDHTIRFEYETPALKTGMIVTAAGGVAIIAYVVIAYVYRRKRKDVENVGE